MKYIHIFLILIFCMACKGQTGKGIASVAEEDYVFPMIEIPSTLLTPEERAGYLTLHYWDNFDFGDTALLRHQAVVEQAFVDYIDVFPYTNVATVAASIRNMFNECGGEEKMFAFFSDLYEKYLYDPLSSMRNDEFYIPVLEAMMTSPALKDKTRTEMLLSLARKNRVGEVATDFVYTKGDNSKGRLHALAYDYTLIFFYNPECRNCKEVSANLQGSEAVKAALSTPKRLVILALYTDKDVEAWRRYLSNMPKDWVVGYDGGQRIEEEQLYDLKAIPSLYLLDRDKKVVLKDAGFEQVEEYLKGL